MHSSSIHVEDCDLFQGLETSVLERVRTLVEERSYSARDTVFSEGDAATELYILASGEVELTYTLPNRPEVSMNIKRIVPGEVFAFSALVQGRRLTAKAEARSDSRVYAIPAENLESLLAEHSDVGYVVMRRLAALIRTRLRDTRAELRWMQGYE